MDSQDILVFGNCGKYDGNIPSVPDNLEESAIIICQSCGAIIGTWGDIKNGAAQHVTEAVNEELKDSLREAFKNDKNIRFE